MRVEDVCVHDAATTAVVAAEAAIVAATTTTTATATTAHDVVDVEDVRVYDAHEQSTRRRWCAQCVAYDDDNDDAAATTTAEESDENASEASTVTPTFVPSRRHHSFFDLDNDATSTPPSPKAGERSDADADDEDGTATAARRAVRGDEEAAQPAQQASSHRPAHHPPQRGHATDTCAAAAAVPYDYQRCLLSCGRRCRGLALYRVDDVPVWQRFNPYIRSGYRAYYSTACTLHSLLGWHNESVNVWSHLLGFVVFALLSTTLLLRRTFTASAADGGGDGSVVYTAAATATSEAAADTAATAAATAARTTTTMTTATTTMDERLSSSTLVYALYCGGCMLCMLSSTLYHLFNGHRHHRVVVAAGRLDFIGITLLIVTSFLPPLYVLLQCNPLARRVYMTHIIAAGCGGVVAPWTDMFYRHLWLRTGVYASMACSGIAPLVHVLCVLPYTAATMTMVHGVVLMAALYVAGLVCYVSHFPEAVFAGHFDCLLSSHQLWHAFVLMAALVHYCNAVSIFQTWAVTDKMC